MKQKLILLNGSPCVGKTTIADGLLNLYENSAHLDDDWVWRVNPFSFDDSRNNSIFDNMAFILSNYLNLNFDLVILSTVRMISGDRGTLLSKIIADDYMTIGFTLKCSEETLVERHKKRGDEGECDFRWLRLDPYPNDFVINTDDKTIERVVDEIKEIINMRSE